MIIGCQAALFVMICSMHTSIVPYDKEHLLTSIFYLLFFVYYLISHCSLSITLILTHVTFLYNMINTSPLHYSLFNPRKRLLR